MEIPETRSRLVRPLYLALAFFLGAGAVKAVIIAASSNRVDLSWLISIGEKAFIIFSTFGGIVLLRWLIVDAPFNLLRSYTAAPLLKSVISMLIYAGAAIILIHRLFSINLTPLLTTSAVLTGVLVLSLQETFKNLFTGLWINTERLVVKGDWVRIADKEGQVVEVTWRTTRILTRGNDYIYLPNRLLAEGILENFTYPTSLHVVEIGVDASYNDPPNKVKSVLLDMARDTPSVLSQPEPEVLVANFSESSIHYRLRVWVDDFSLTSAVKSEINGKIWYAFKRNHIEIPFPVRVIYSRTEGRPSEPDVVTALKNIEFLSPLKEDELEKVAALSRFEVFGAGESIVRQGDTGDTCYLIGSGRVDVLLRDPEVGERFIATLSPGEFFGEMSLLAGEPRKATVIAREDTSCIVLTPHAFKSIFVENPDLAERFSELLVKRSGELEEIKDWAMSEREKKEAEKAAQKNIMNKIRQFFQM